MKLRQNWSGGGVFKKIADILNSHAKWMNNVAGFDGCQVQPNTHSGSIDIYAPRQFSQFAGPAHDVGDVKLFLPPGASLSAQLAQIGSGWHFLNGAAIAMPDESTWTLENCRGKYFVGFDDASSPDADLDALGVAKNSNTWTGFKNHGTTENNHANHYCQHIHVRDDGSNRTLANGYDHADNDGFPTWDTNVPDGAEGAMGGAGGGVFAHVGVKTIEGVETIVTDTDNRPPSCVAFALIWIGLPTVNGILPTA